MDDTRINHRLNTLYIAMQVQRISLPLLKKGGIPLSQIYINYVLQEIPISRSTFYRHMRIEISPCEYHERLRIFRDAQIDRILNENRKMCRRRAAARRMAMRSTSCAAEP